MQRMTDLVLTHDAGGAHPDARVIALTRTLTVTAVRELDGARKGLVVQFLSESGILRNRKDGPDLLDEADRHGARLERMVLDDMNLAGADLHDARLDAAFLEGTRFFGANLRGASLREAATSSGGAAADAATGAATLVRLGSCGGQRMEFRLLGPLEVSDGDRRIEIGRGRRRSLLALLLMRPNEVVSAERLIDELWGERPTATATKSLHVYVSQLRKELQASGDG
jgi:hypothetical protein